MRRKSLGSSRHSAISNSSQRGFSFVDSISGGGSNDIIEVEGPAGESKEGMGSIPSLPKDYSFGTVSGCGWYTYSVATVMFLYC